MAFWLDPCWFNWWKCDIQPLVMCLSNTCEAILCRFWKIDDTPLSEEVMSPKEQSSTSKPITPTWAVVDLLSRFQRNKMLNTLELESCSQAVHRFLSLERTLCAKNQFDQFDEIIKEYFDLGHAELVPSKELNLPISPTFSTYQCMLCISRPVQLPRFMRRTDCWANCAPLTSRCPHSFSHA